MEEEVKNDPGTELAKVLSAFPDAPNKEEIEQMKSLHGEVFCSGMSESELFIFRPLKRQEYVEMQNTLSQAQTPVSQFQVEEDTVTKCVLWASKDGLSSLKDKAGTLTTLNEQILQNSNFIAPAVAASLVIKL